jgi:predicted GNAT superfamily acetyltransferase
MGATASSFDIVAAASEAASKAAARGGVTIRALDDVSQIQDAVDLFQTIWGRGDRDLVGVSTLRALAHSGNYVCGAYVGDSLVSAIIGFVGWHHGGLQLHSHILGVAPGNQGRHVGFAMKEHQRWWCLDRDISTITWTFDPLVSRNAYFNLTKLGASVTDYYVGFYGEMDDEINAGDESDRVLIEWSLDSVRAAAASVGDVRAPKRESLITKGAEVALDVGPDEAPIEKSASGGTMLVGLPRDIVELRGKDPELARRWRFALRDVLQGSLSDGYEIRAMTRSGYYVVEKVR